mgnify:FL=1
MKHLYNIWLYALGSYSDEKTKPYDTSMLLIRSAWIILHVVTCLFIIIGNGRVMGWW